MAFEAQIVEAKLALSLIHPEEMPNLAADALEAGFDGPATRRMAALINPSGWEVDQLQPEFMNECGLTTIDRKEAAVRVATHLAKTILENGFDPLNYQRDFYSLWIEGDYPAKLQYIGNLDDQLSFQSEADVRKFAIEELQNLITTNPPSNSHTSNSATSPPQSTPSP